MVDVRLCSEGAELEAMKTHPKFTVEARKRILEGVQLGLPPSKACELACIKKSTFEGWMNKGFISDDPDDPFHVFYLQVREQDARLESKWIKFTEASNNPKIALDLLKLRFSEDFGSRSTVEHTGDVLASVELKTKKDRLMRMLNNDED